MGRYDKSGVDFEVRDRSRAGVNSALQNMSRLERSTKSLKRSLGGALAFGAGYLGVRSIVNGFGSISKAAMDAQESENLFAVSMDTTASKARAWSKEMSDALGLNEYAARRNIATYKVMLESMGLTEQSAYDVAKSMTQLAYDMASFYNLRPEEAFQKIQAGLTGEIEPLKRLGIIVNETSVKEYAARQGWVKHGEQLSEVGKIYARTGLILDQTSKAQGDLERTADSTTNVVRSLGEVGTETKVVLGEALLPAVTKLAGGLRDFLKDNRREIKRWADDFVEGVGIVTEAMDRLSTADDTFREAFDSLSRSDQQSIAKAYLDTTGQRMGYQKVGVGGIGGGMTGTMTKFIEPANMGYAKALVDSFQRSRDPSDPVADLKSRVTGLNYDAIAPREGELLIKSASSAKAAASATSEMRKEKERAVKMVDRLNAELDREFTIINRLGDSHERAAKMVDYELSVREAYGDNIALTKDLIGEYEQKLIALEKFERMTKIGDEIGQSVGGALEAIRRNAGDAESAVDSLLDSLASLAMRAAIYDPIERSISNAFVGLFNFSGGAAAAKTVPAGDINPAMAGVAHGGGVVGQLTRHRAVPASLFAGAERAHRGKYIGAGEVPIIAQTGETILPRGASATPNINVNIANESGEAIEADGIDVQVDNGEVTIGMLIRNVQRGGRLRRGILGR